MNELPSAHVPPFSRRATHGWPTRRRRWIVYEQRYLFTGSVGEQRGLAPKTTRGAAGKPPTWG